MAKPREFEVQQAGAVTFRHRVDTAKQQLDGMRVCFHFIDASGQPALIRERSVTASGWAFWRYKPGDRWAHRVARQDAGWVES